MKNKRSHLDIMTLVLSVLAGAIWLFLGGAITSILLRKIWPPLAIAFFFGGLACVLILVAWLCTIARGFTMAPKKYYGYAALVALGIFVLSGLFQWAYSGSIQISEPDRSSYIFMIDDSGSIGGDPMHLREEAVRQVMAGCEDDYPFAVYAFASDCRMLQGVQPASTARNMSLDLVSKGGTNVVEALEMVENDILFGRLQAGSSPRIILVTDGEFDDSGLREVLSNAVAMNITVCTIGMTGSNPTVLKLIADLTNGVNVTIDKLDQLPGAMETVAIGESDFIRTLLSVRNPVPMDWIYSVMRVVFLLILGALFIWIKALLLRSDDMEANMLIPNLVAVLIGALCVEIGMNILFLQERVMQTIMCVGFTILLTVVLNRGVSGGPNVVIDTVDPFAPPGDDWGSSGGSYGGSYGNSGWGGDSGNSGSYGGGSGYDGGYGGSGGSYGGDDWG